MHETATTEEGRIDPSLCSALVERVCASKELCRAGRLRDFLRYVTQRALDETGTPITEHEIGVNVFGRKQEYDTGIDNIVRVNASELRKRIGGYFELEGASERIHLEIPRGSYTPTFFSPSALAEPSQNASPAGEHPSPLEIDRAAPSRRWKSRWLVPALSALVVILAVMCAGLVLALRHAQQANEPWRNGASLRAFWGHLFDNQRTTDIVLADSSLPIAQEFLKRRISLSLYLKPDYAQALAHADLPDNLRGELQRFASRSIASFTDFHAAQHILALSPAPGKLKLEYARRLRAESLKSDNVILIGSNYSNPWVDLFDSRLNFHMATDPLTRQAQVINSSPRAGEQAVYASAPDARDTVGYCTLAFIPGAEHGPSVLIIAGTTSEATEAAVDFITSERSLEELTEKYHIANFSHFELLLRTTRLENTALSAEIVAVRF